SLVLLSGRQSAFPRRSRPGALSGMGGRRLYHSDTGQCGRFPGGGRPDPRTCSTLSCAGNRLRSASCRVMMANLLEEGLPVVEFRQGWVSMAPAVKELERAIIGRRFKHGGHPVLRWNFENIAIHTDQAGNRSFHKGKSRDRIDGAVASAMAVSRCHDGNSNRSSYDTVQEFDEEWFAV